MLSAQFGWQLRMVSPMSPIFEMFIGSFIVPLNRNLSWFWRCFFSKFAFLCFMMHELIFCDFNWHLLMAHLSFIHFIICPIICPKLWFTDNCSLSGRLSAFGLISEKTVWLIAYGNEILTEIKFNERPLFLPEYSKRLIRIICILLVVYRMNLALKWWLNSGNDIPQWDRIKRQKK